ncbi:MAG: rhomboid family intramembrane serine protease [Chitinophagaceae bacterium]|nr:MAG: rhomboid family intramembrane serine protease [Chitinophagaceae bacterium]
MGETDRYQEYRQPKTSFRLGDDGNALVALFAINVVFFLLLLLIEVGYNYSQRAAADYDNEIVRWFALPGNLTAFLQKPWTLFIYMFSDVKLGFIRLASNMIWLWAFGSLLQQMAGNSKLIPVYIYGGIVGGLFFIGAYNLIPSIQQEAGGSILGANTGVMAVAMATTTLSPNFRFFTQIRNGIPIWILMGIYILIDLAGIAGNGAAYSIAHLGAALAGFLFVVLLRRGKDGSIWMHAFYNWLKNLFEPGKKSTSQNVREKVFYETGGRKPFHKTSLITQQRVDEILDKINQKGFQFLTDEEKQILKKASEGDEL